MKKLRTTLMTALSIFAVVAFISCGNKDDNGTKPDPDPDPDPDPTEATFEYFQPLTGEAGATVSIIGKDFGTDKEKVKVWFDDKELEVTNIAGGVRIDVKLPQIVGNTYKVKVKVRDEEPYTFDALFTYPLLFSDVSTFAGAGGAGNDDGAAASAKFSRPASLVYDKKDNALFVHEDPEQGGARLRRIKDGQVETIMTYPNGGTPNNIRSVAISMSADTLFFANDRGGNTNRGVVYIAKRGDDFKTLTCLIGPAGSSPEVESDGQHFNHAAVHPTTGKLYMWDWRGYVYSWNKKSKTAVQVSNFLEAGLGLLTGGNYSTITFSKDGTKIYVVGRNGASVMFVADYNVASDEISGDFRVFAGSATVAGNTDGTGIEARFNEPYHYMFGADGFLYGGDMKNWSLRKVSPDAKVTTIGGVGTWSAIDGPLSTAGFDAPASVAFDKDCNMYIADIYNHKIRKIAVVTQ